MKLYKKLGIAVLSLLMCASSVYADSVAEVQIAEDGTHARLSGTVDLHDFGFSDGQIKTDRQPYFPLQIAVVISDSSTGEELFIYQAKADNNGTYGTQFILPVEYGDYNIELYTAYGKIYEGTVNYVDGTVSEINDISNTSDDFGNLRDYIVSYSRYVGLDMSLYNQFTDAEQQRVIESVAKNAPYGKKNDVGLVFSNAVFEVGLGNETLSDEYKSKMFNDYMDNLGDEYNNISEFIKKYNLGAGIISLFNDGEYESVKADIQILALKSYLNSKIQNIYDFEPLFTDVNLFSIPDDTLNKYKAVTDYSAFYSSLNSSRNEINSLKDFYDKIERSIPSESKKDDKNDKRGGSGGGGGSYISGPSVPSEIPKVEVPDNPIVNSADTMFSDLTSYDWAKTAIYELSKAGAVNGSGNGTFLPSNNITREEFAKIAAVSFGISSAENTGKAFSDVNDSDWFSGPVKAMTSNNIIKGISDSEFGIGKPITRQDAATILSRILNLNEDSAKESFADDSSIAEYAKAGIYALKAGNMISGYEDNTFRPDGLLTRAEAAQMIYNILKLGKGVINLE